MSLKRKRSSVDLSSSASPSSDMDMEIESHAVATHPVPYLSSSPPVGACASPMGFAGHVKASSNTSGRTLKRFRDGRPSERVIHGMFGFVRLTSRALELRLPGLALGRLCVLAVSLFLYFGESDAPNAIYHTDEGPDLRQLERTLNLLYAAQRRLAHGSSTSASASRVAPPSRHPSTDSASSNATLDASHGNAIRNPHEPAPSLFSLMMSSRDVTATRPRAAPRCQDCDTPVGGFQDPQFSGAGDDGRAGDSSEADENACVTCRRVVCATCSVVEMDRQCLECACA